MPMRPIDFDHNFPRTADIQSDADADTYAAARAAVLEAASSLAKGADAGERVFTERTEGEQGSRRRRKRRRRTAAATVPCRMCGGARFRSGGLCQDCFSPNLMQMQDGTRSITVMTDAEVEADTLVDSRDAAPDAHAVDAIDAHATSAARESADADASETVAAVVADRIGPRRRRSHRSRRDVDAELAAMDTVPMAMVVAEPAACVALGPVGSESTGSDADSNAALPVPEFAEDDELAPDAAPLTLLERVRERKRRRGGRRGVAGVLAAAGDRIKGHMVAIAVHAVAILAIWSLVVGAEELEKAGALGISVTLDKGEAKAPPPSVTSESSSESAAERAAAEAMPTESPRIDHLLERPVATTTDTANALDGMPRRNAPTRVEAPFDDGVSGDEFGRQFRERSRGNRAKLLLPAGPISLFGTDVPGQRILFVIDASTSMATPITTHDGVRSTRWELVKRELLDALAGMQQQRDAQVAANPAGDARYAFDIVCYHHEVSAFAHSLVPPTEEEIEHVREWIERITPAGATNWKAALTHAYDYLNLDTLYFLSDGWPNYPDPNTEAGEWEDLARERRVERGDAFAFVGTQFGGYSGLSPAFKKLVEVSAPNAFSAFVSDVSAEPGQIAQFLSMFTDDPDMVADVFKAIDNGTNVLLREQKSDGSFADTHGYDIGPGALALLAMNKAYMTLYPGDAATLRSERQDLERLERADGLSREQKVYLEYLRERAGDEAKLRDDLHKGIEAGMDWVRERFDKPFEHWPLRTYTVGIVLLLMEAYYTRVMPTPDGYALSLTPHDLNKKDRFIVRELANWLEERYAAAMGNVDKYNGAIGPFWSYGVGREGMGDNSNAQYAVLGLKAAAKLGVHVKSDDLWRDVARYYIDTQDEDGELTARRESRVVEGKMELLEQPDEEYVKYDRARGWGYRGYARLADGSTTDLDEKLNQMLAQRSNSSPSMTTAGLGALLVAQSELYHAGVLPADRALDRELDQAIYDGLARLGRWRMHSSTYFLYGCERVGAFARVDHFGPTFWYIEGAQQLIQTGGGGRKGWGSLHDTAFAVLFLARGTAPVQDMREPLPPETEDE